jgi:putative heme-binding domain-containing protein
MRLVAVLPFAATLFAQHGRYLSESRNPAIGNPEAIEKGSKLYATSCAACHGPDGSGGRGPNLVRRPLWHPLSDEDIFRTIRNGVPGADMPPTKLPDAETWDLVAFIHALIGPASENRVPGDAAAGEQVFRGSKAACADCHSIRGEGGRLGPDLSNIGSRPLAVIKDAVLKRSKDLTLLGEEPVTITLNNGQTIEGIARNRSNYSLQVVEKGGSLHLIRMEDVKELNIAQRSLMPNDYGKRLSPRELQDLLAFLARQNMRAPAVATDMEKN